MTRYRVLAIFPALLVVKSVLGLIGGSVTDSLIKNLEDVAPDQAQEIFTDFGEGLDSLRACGKTGAYRSQPHRVSGSAG